LLLGFEKEVLSSSSGNFKTEMDIESYPHNRLLREPKATAPPPSARFIQSPPTIIISKFFADACRKANSFALL
jgi:hypothetical protein